MISPRLRAFFESFQQQAVTTRRLSASALLAENLPRCCPVQPSGATSQLMIPHMSGSRISTMTKETSMNMTLSLTPMVSLIAGILILIVPRLLNYIVAFYLILIGVIGLFG
jgi:hypothetical protein